MAQIEPTTARRKAVRYGIPAGVAGITALTLGLVPALADVGAPDLPEISAKELVAKMAASDVEQMTGTVKISTDLGLPELPGAGSGGGPQGGLFGGMADEDGKGRQGKTAEPREKLMELFSGEHTVEVALDGPERQRVNIVESGSSQYSYVHDGNEMWAYDSSAKTALHAKGPKGAGKHGGFGGHGEDRKDGKHHKDGKHRGMRGGLGDVTPQKAAEQMLKAAKGTTSVTVDGTAQVAGRDAYQLVLKPKDAPHSTVEAVRIAVDAENGTPLKFTLAPKGGGAPIAEVTYTEVDFGKPSASTFDFKPPKGTKVTEAGPHGKGLKDFKGKGLKGDGFKGDGFEGKGPKLSEKDLKELKELKKSGKLKDFEKFGKFDEFKKHEKHEKHGKGGPFGPFGPGLPFGPNGGDGMDVLGKGWGAVAAIDMGKGMADAPKSGKKNGKPGDSAQSDQLFDTFSEKAEGDFGKGRVFSTRLFNVLMTDDGKLYAGAVTKEGLVKAANAAAE